MTKPAFAARLKELHAAAASDGGPIVILPEEWDLLCTTRTVREWIDKYGTLDVVPENEDALALLAALHDQEAEAWRVLREIPVERIAAYQISWRHFFRAISVLVVAARKADRVIPHAQMTLRAALERVNG